MITSAYTKRSVYTLVVCLSIINNVICTPLMSQNTSYVPTRNNSIPPPRNIAPLYAKPILIPVDDDFMPTLSKLLQTRSIRKSPHPRRALSLKLLTLLLQDDKPNTTATVEPIAPIPETTHPIRGDSTWTPPPHAAVGIDLIWSGNIHSVQANPAIWKGGFGKPTIVTGSTAETGGDTTTTPQGTAPIDAGNDVELVLRPVDGWVEQPVIDVIDVWPV
jgi:hypothetical protein